jgi:predicted nucleic acid-binding Zn ribbon protein
MKPKARREPQRVGSILEKTLKNMSLEGKLKQHEVWNVWDDVVGEHVSRHAQPEFMKSGILFVKVSSSPWMQQLHYMGKGIIKALNARLGLLIVEEIRFKLGEIDPSRKQASSPPQSPPPTPSPAKDTPKRIQKALSPIRDMKIREILGRVMLKDLGRRKGKPH